MNIDKKDFIKIVSILQEAQKRDEDLNRLFKLNLIEFTEDYHTVIDMLLSSLFNTAQIDWFNWWFYERIPPTGGATLKAYNDDKTEIILDTPEMLYEFLKTV